MSLGHRMHAGATWLAVGNTGSQAVSFISGSNWHACSFQRLMFLPLVNLPGSMLYREMRFKAKTGVKVISLLVSSLTIIALAYTGHGVRRLIFGGIAGAITNMLLLIPLSGWRPGLSLDLRRGCDIARNGLVTVTDILVYLRQQVSLFILSRTLGACQCRPLQHRATLESTDNNNPKRDRQRNRLELTKP